ncbi:hypothetical protein PL263_03910 [Methylomonas sp. EFPC3]|uniref:hypothetical protein n=1 Tax=Methylomonas sp. EFPC3 TaxID=3021710 RepID=UPI002416306B|nr:hypothetical protein [Methylomonas sp. EFPC3]WFP51177.1 hypothetical protein PL263_03910 [Methylomonas sp. EFPC3]
MLKALLFALFSTAALLAVLLLFAIDDSPLPSLNQGLTRDDIQRAKQLLQVRPEERSQLKTVNLDQKDLNIATSYLLDHFVENTTQVHFGQDRIDCQIAVFVPETLFGHYLDFSFSVRQLNDSIRLKSFKVGEISIPDPAANLLIPALVTHTPLNDYWQVLTQYVKNVQIGPQTLEISYLGSIADAAKQLVIRKHAEYPNLHLYQQQINDIVNRHDPDWRLSLIELLQPLFATAYQNTPEADAIQENRAIIIAVASYIYKRDLRRFLPVGLVYSKEYPVFAYKRVDIPQHFIASALLAAVDASLLGERMGVDKELGDARQGSGFSFIDLSADMAGSRFGRMAIASQTKARLLQKLMAETKDYSAIIPEVQDLPEHMDEMDFKQRFERVGSKRYQEVISEIDKRLDDLPLYQ